MAPIIFNTGETTVAGPAVTVFNDQTVLAWAGGGGAGGGPANLHLNLKHSGLDPNPTTWEKVVLDDTSTESVALAGFRGRIYLAWTGTGGPPHLNLRSGTTIQDLASTNDKQTLGDQCNGGPAITAHRGLLVRAWTGTDGGASGHVNLAWSADGHSWPDQNRLLLDSVSVTGPALLNTTDDAGNEYLYVAWTDAEQHIWVTVTGNAEFDRLGHDMVRLGSETTIAGPGLGAFNSGAFVAPDQVIVSWAGTNPAHNINIMNAGTATTDFGFKKTWGETALSNVSEARFGPALKYAYKGTDGIGGLYLGSRKADDL